VSTEDEETSKEVFHHTVTKPAAVKSPQSPHRSEYIEQVLVEIVSTVLTARPWAWRTSGGNGKLSKTNFQRPQADGGVWAWPGEKQDVSCALTEVFLSQEVCIGEQRWFSFCASLRTQWFL